MTLTLLDEALALAALDIPVFPLRENKRPACDGGFKAATTDPAEIARLFANPLSALIGVPTGEASGFDVIDVDVSRGGLEWLAVNEHRLPVTRRHHTRSGGAHLLLRHTPGMRTRFDRIAPGVEVRGTGGYISWWPARGLHTEGSGWAAWPEWLLVEALKSGGGPNAAAPTPDDLTPPSAEALVDVLRAMPNPPTVTRGEYVGLNLAVAGCLRAMITLDRCTQDQAEDIRDAAAEWSARWESTTASDFETERRRWESDWSTRTNDVSGWRHVLGLAERLGVPVDLHRQDAAAAEFETSAAAAAPNVPARARCGTIDAAPAELTEESCARGFAAAHAGALAYDHTGRCWVAFDGAIWRRVERASATWAVREYVAQARAVFGNSDKPAAGVSFGANVEKASRSDPLLAVSADVWDRNPWLLGVPGGVVDLRTGDLLPGDAGRYISRCCSVAPAPSATDAPVWLGFLSFATGGNVNLQAWLQRFAGYCLTGDMREEMFAFFYGPGGNGKGTFLHALASVMDAYAFQAPADLFRANGRTNPEYQLAKLAGRRAVFASELESGAAFAEGLVKELTGNEGKINARNPYGEPFEFRFQGKLLLVSNHAPRLRGRSAALERRMRVVPFDNAPPRRDDTLKERMRPEYPAILRWAIDGCLAWQRQGIGWCEVVRAASAAYFEDQDTFGRWAAERLDHGPALQIKRTDLYADYATWSHGAGETPLVPAEFYETARRALGCEDRMSNGVRFLRGVGLRAETGDVDATDNRAADLARLVN